MRGDHDTLAHVPPRTVHDQHDLLVGTRSRLLGEGGERVGEELHVDARAQMPLGPPGGGVDVASEVPPAIAGMDHDHRPLPPQRPDATQDGLEPMRCSSVAHTSTTAPGCSSATAAALVARFF